MPWILKTTVLSAVVRLSRPFRIEDLLKAYAAAYVYGIPGRAPSEATGFACQAPVAEVEKLWGLLEQ